MLAILVLACIGCGSSREDLRAQAERQEKERLARAVPNHSLQSFDGTVNGKDLGEWGGEVTFRERDGSEYQLIADNSQGIFNMPFGVVAVTGLAHLQENRGSVYVLSRVPGGRVRAVKTLTLPGWPCQASASDAQVMLRTFLGHEAEKPKYRCYSLQSPKVAVPASCPLVIPDGCFQ